MGGRHRGKWSGAPQCPQRPRNSVPSVHVAVVFGEVAAGNFHADLMTLLEYHTSAAHVDLIAVYGTRESAALPDPDPRGSGSE